MSTVEYRKNAAVLLKGRYAEGFAVTFALIAVFLIFKAADVMTASAVVLLNKGDLSELISGGGVFGTVISAARSVFCFLLMTPLLTGGFWWFCQTAQGLDNIGILKVYSGVRLNFRAAAVYALMWLRGLLALIPSGLCWLGASAAFELACKNVYQELMMFLSIQLFAAGIFLLGLVLSTAASLSAAPFIFVSRPDMSAFKVLKSSSRLMKGRRCDFIKLMLCYLPPMLPIVTIPFVLPRAAMAAALFVSKEAEKVGTEF